MYVYVCVIRPFYLHTHIYESLQSTLQQDTKVNTLQTLYARMQVLFAYPSVVLCVSDTHTKT